MTPISTADFRLGDCIVRPRRRIIERGDASVHIKPKSMSVLARLVAADGEPVSRNDLFDAVWPGGEVSDDTLTKCIVELRKAFADTARESRFIETIPKFGFRLVVRAEPLEESPPESFSSVPVTGMPARGASPRRRPILSLLLGGVLLVGVLLAVDSSRAWLTEAGVTLFLKASAILAPYSLEQEPGIAVLPFANMSDEADNEYFSDGISAEVINLLGRANRLPVISRNSSFQFKGQNRDIKEIGRLLGVTYVLEGSVRKADGRVRVTTQLIDTATGKQVWSGVYENELSDIFALQNKVAASIVAHIDSALGDGIAPMPPSLPAMVPVRVRRTDSLEAYDLYLKGLQLLKSGNPIPIEQAAGYFDAAIALDEDYADAWAAKGLALYVLGRPGFGHPHIPAAVYPDAIAAFERALEIEPGHGEAAGWLGVTLIVNDYQWEEGMRLMKQSIAQNPSDAELLAVYALHLNIMHMEGAEEMLYRAFHLDPFGTIPIIIRARLLLDAGRLLDASALLKIGLMRNLDGYSANFHSAMLNILIGRLDAAEHNIDKAREMAHPEDLSLDSLQWIVNYKRSGEPLPSPAEILERMQTERLSFFEQRGWVVPWNDSETILAAFELGIEQRHPEMRVILFGPKPPPLAEADWQRLKAITGVAQFQRMHRGILASDRGSGE